MYIFYVFICSVSESKSALKGTQGINMFGNKLKITPFSKEGNFYFHFYSNHLTTQIFRVVDVIFLILSHYLRVDTHLMGLPLWDLVVGTRSCRMTI